MHGKPADGVQLLVQLARRQPQIELINDASSSAVWSTLAASHSQKGSHKDKRQVVNYADMFADAGDIFEQNFRNTTIILLCAPFEFDCVVGADKSLLSRTIPYWRNCLVNVYVQRLMVNIMKINVKVKVLSMNIYLITLAG